MFKGMLNEQSSDNVPRAQFSLS